MDDDSLPPILVGIPWWLLLALLPLVLIVAIPWWIARFVTEVWREGRADADLAARRRRR